MARPRVVIIGSGFGGLEAAKCLADEEVDILLIDRLNHHVFQPLLYQVATGALSAADIAVPIREIFKNQKNIECRMATVTSIRKEQKFIVLADGETLSYDYLIVAPGARHSYFGHQEWEKFAPGLKTLQDALSIRERIVVSFEKAERWSKDKEECEKNLTFVVIGAGPTGVELAGAIGEIALKSLAKEYKKIDTAKAKIYLIDALPRILPSFPEKVSIEAQKALEALDVTIMTNAMVKEVGEEYIEVAGKKIRVGTIIWAAGNEAPPLLRSLETSLDRQGRVLVQPDMSVKGSPELFVIGDAAHSIDNNQQPLPGLAPVAKQQGNYVATIIAKGLKPSKRKPFLYNDRGTMATIGRGQAVALVKGKIYSGLFAWLAWCFIHILYLIGFENRFSVFFRWISLYITYHRHVLLIKQPMDEEFHHPSLKHLVDE